MRVAVARGVLQDRGKVDKKTLRARETARENRRGD